MTLPPLWKVRRELVRIWVKLGLVLGRWLYDPVRKPVYDLTVQWRQRLTQGSFPLTDRVAVFLVFQPKGIPPSIFLTLEHLRQNRFSVLLVSNGALRPEDRTRLASNAALVLERPNVGYDFGGYRDGIRHLWSMKHDLSLLVLMNDSTWFPLRRDDDSLARMEALEADLAGHIFKTESEEKRGKDHVESHLLMISKDFLQSTDFNRFWSDYQMSDYRVTTIDKGEKGFSQVALSSGRKVTALMDRERMIDALRSLNDVDLRIVLDHTIDGFRGREQDASAIRRSAGQGERWRDAYFTWIDQSLSNSGTFMISATFVMPALLYLGMGFAKKAKDIRFHQAREELLDLEASGMLPPIDDLVRAEISASVQYWTPPKGLEAIAKKRTSSPLPISG